MHSSRDVQKGDIYRLIQVTRHLWSDKDFYNETLQCVGRVCKIIYRSAVNEDIIRVEGLLPPSSRWYSQSWGVPLCDVEYLPNGEEEYVAQCILDTISQP